MHISAHNYINEWVQLSGNYNWTNWTLIELSYENDIALDGMEFRVVILGLGYRVRVQRSPLFETEKGEDLKKRIEEIKEEEHENS